MLPLLWVVAATLLSGAQAVDLRRLPREAFRRDASFSTETPIGTPPFTPMTPLVTFSKTTTSLISTSTSTTSTISTPRAASKSTISTSIIISESTPLSGLTTGSETATGSVPPSGSETPTGSVTTTGSETTTASQTPSGAETPTDSVTTTDSQTPIGSVTTTGSETTIGSETTTGSETSTASETTTESETTIASVTSSTTTNPAEPEGGDDGPTETITTSTSLSGGDGPTETITTSTSFGGGDGPIESITTSTSLDGGDGPTETITTSTSLGGGDGPIESITTSSSLGGGDVDLTFGSNGGITIPGVITIPSAALPTGFQATGTGGLYLIAASATSASAAFTDLAAAAPFLAANPSLTSDQIITFQKQAEDTFEQLTNLQYELKSIDKSSLDDDDSHKVIAGILGLGGLLAFLSTQLGALATVVATPTLATDVLHSIALALGGAITGDLLLNAFKDILDLGKHNNDDPNHQDDPKHPDDPEDPDDPDDTGSQSVSKTRSRTSTKTSTGTTTGTTTGASTQTTTTTSCTFETALQVTVICSPTIILEPSLITTTTCFSSHTITATGCDVTQETTTITETASATFQPPCSPETCGDSCPIRGPRGPLSGAQMSEVATGDCADVPTSTLANLPTATNGLITPKRDWSPGAVGKKLDDQLLSKRILPDANNPDRSYVSSLAPNWVSQMGDVTGQWYDSPEVGQGTAAAGVNGIYGCTAVVIVSSQGVYVSHIWEVPVFQKADPQSPDPARPRYIDTDGEVFRTSSWRGLLYGYFQNGVQTAFPITQLVGTDSNPGVLHWSFHPHIHVITPRTTTYDRDELKIYTDLKYELRVTEIADMLQWAIPGSVALIHGYTRTNQQVSTGIGYEGRTILEIDQLEYWLQDSSGNNVGSEGKWRLWVEDRNVAEFTFPSKVPPSLIKRVGSDVCVPKPRTTESVTSETATGTSTTESVTTTESAITTESITTTESGTTTESVTTTKSVTTIESVTTSTVSTATTFTTTIISSQSQSTSEITTSSTSTYIAPPVRTVTVGDKVCKLYPGSVDPVCKPIETPIPNPGGTNIHVQSGCVLIMGSPRCAPDAGNIASVYQSFYSNAVHPACCANNLLTPWPPADVASDPNEPYSTALILSGFDHGNDNRLHAKATCQLQARWPADIGDIFFHEDGCLYDSDQNKIFDQCCSTPDVDNNGLTTNPYVAPAPADSYQISGNNKGSAICASLDDQTCLTAASRYIDDVVYHQYTSAVFPDGSGADIANEIFPIAGPIIEDFFGIHYGCTVIWRCSDDAAYGRGMTGKQIKDAMAEMYKQNRAKRCGSTYLANGCAITANGCNNCRDWGRDYTMWNPFDVFNGTYDDVNDGFPPKR